MGSCESDHMSDIALQLADASASTPYRGSYISLRNGEGVLVNRVQMEVAMPRSRRSAFRHQFQCISGELHASTSRAFGQCCNEKLHKSIYFQRLPCLHVHHPVHNSCRGPLWSSVFAQHFKARGKERSLALQTRVSHPRTDTPPPDPLSFDTVLQTEATADTCAYVQC